MDNPLVSIIIVNWNGERYLKDCLDSLKVQTYKNTEVFFVDNASIDTSVAFAKKEFPYFHFIVNKKNLGYAEGHDEAFERAKGELVLLLSMDTILEKDALKQMVDTMGSDSRIGAVQPKLLMWPQKNLIDSIGMFFLVSGLLYHYGREKEHTAAKYNKQMEIFSAKGACLLFRKSTLKKTGLFDKGYFAYFEDTDLCHRVWLAGYTVIYTPKAVVYHTGGGASKRMASSHILFHSYKNRLQTYLKNLSWKYLVRVLPLTILVYMGASIAYLSRGDIKVAIAIQKSILWNIINVKKILLKRKHVQSKVRVVRDDDFLPRLTKPVYLSYYYYIFYGLKKYKDRRWL